jgi:hypothetical protein
VHSEGFAAARDALAASGRRAVQGLPHRGAFELVGDACLLLLLVSLLLHSIGLTVLALAVITLDAAVAVLFRLNPRLADELLGCQWSAPGILR